MTDVVPMPNAGAPLPEGIKHSDVTMVYILDRTEEFRICGSKPLPTYTVWVEAYPDDEDRMAVEEFDWDTDDHEAAKDYAWTLCARFGFPEFEEY